ncbi:formamidopyrimidine-DNA glycosylase [Caldalkalibacillus thermarum]|uniref:DNA-formamidopyrimidine glycosylase n=1 Tax=Caldalkalibacillus thermarum TaxID=296745 RepID=UPI0016637E27|nr:DNA-formamidopyrimidine glycosylase [Caldalkalibacillus thermarum]GGK11542.1 formamidopyrimidine-DNA glycosylase [Caldalkalibacillus thermarum]
MPELPEVEVVRRTLTKEITNKVIKQVDVFWPRIITYPDNQDEFKLGLEGQKIGKLGRKGKYLLIEIGQHHELVVHFRMTGKFKLLPPEERFQKHIHLFFHFQGEKEGLAYHDVRKFGDFFLVPKGDYRVIKGLYQAGIDPLDASFTYERFHGLLKSRKRQVKALLLDQSVIAGLGNYLCDELLWFPGEQGVHPARLSHELNEREMKGMYHRMLDVIHQSIRLGGNSFRDFSYGNGIKGQFKQMLKVYAREGEPCFNCGTPIRRETVAGRSSHFCPACQPDSIS